MSSRLSGAVQVAVVAVSDDPRDAAAVALAQQYAALIDNAVYAARYRVPLDALRRALRMLAETEPLAAGQAGEALDKVADALAAHSVASDLGPKLLAALTALGLTPAARAASLKEGGQGGAAVADRPESEFERLRRERREREGRARAHGA